MCSPKMSSPCARRERCRPHELAEALARGLADGGVALGARLPVVREAVVRRRSYEAAVTAGTLAAFSGAGRPLLPVLALAQARTMRRLGEASGAATSSDPAAAVQSTAKNLGAALAVGLTCRTIARRLPGRSRLVEGALAAAGTYALARFRLAQDRTPPPRA